MAIQGFLDLTTLPDQAGDFDWGFGRDTFNPTRVRSRVSESGNRQSFVRNIFATPGAFPANLLDCLVSP